MTLKVKKSVDLYNEKKIYNENQEILTRKFVAYRNYISKSPKNITRQLLTKIHSDIIGFQSEFKNLLTISDTYHILLTLHTVKKPIEKIEHVDLSHQLAYFSGRFTKKERDDLS